MEIKHWIGIGVLWAIAFCPPAFAGSTLTTTLADALLIDTNFDGMASPGDTLRYTAGATASSSTNNVIFSVTPDVNTALVVGSVTTAQGSVVTGNTAGDTAVNVNLGVVTSGPPLTIIFDVLIDDPFPMGTTTISIQGSLSGDGVSAVPTDDPDTADPLDPTITSSADLPVTLLQFFVD